MRKEVKLFGRPVPLWIIAVALVSIIGVGAVAMYAIGVIRMHWAVVHPPTLSPSEIVIDMGTLYCGQTVTVEPMDVADLVVENGPIDITFELSGDYGGFNAIAITIQLVQDGQVMYEAVIEPTIVVSNVMYPSPTGVGGWSDKEASRLGYVETCFVRVLAGEGDLAQLVKWVPGASITVGDETYTYPETPFGYVYDETIPETGYIFQNDNDAGEQIQLVLVYPSTSVTIEGIEPGTYDVYVGYTVTAGNVECSGEIVINVSVSNP